MLRRTFVALSLLAGLAPAALAQGQKPVRIGVLNDLSGVYADYQGEGSIIAARMAVEDFGGKVAGRPVEVVFADHQNKTDVGASIARRWFDVDGVDMIVDVPNSAIALAINGLAREKNKVLIGSGAGTSELTGKSCSPNTVHWTYDTYSLGRSLGKALTAQGAKKWFFITADYAFGKDLEKNAADAVLANGGEVVGTARHPIGATDFSSFIVQAQNSGADVIGLANAGDDLSNSIKQAGDFGVASKQRIAALIANVNNIQGLGLPASQGLQVVTGYYWDLNEGTRAFAKRFQERHPRKNMPNDMQAGVYASVLHYLKAVEQAKSADDGRVVVAAMKTISTDDPLFGKGTIRADGRKMHPMHLFTTKTPQESKGPWDFYNLVRSIPAEEAFRPLAEGGCPLASQ
ncbi:MAG TPA: ABC transporter substrate-binding protein [Microvirga sp.]|jgi:branched-chain amino acid transport system substrate-binding protein|nr:ABC transporter substrate-binding protein [Microvirga sp.]